MDDLQQTKQRLQLIPDLLEALFDTTIINNEQDNLTS